MKIPHLPLLLASAAALSRAATPTNCNVGTKKIDTPEKFVLADQGDNPNLKSLSTIFATNNSRVSVAQVFADGNLKMTGNDANKKSWASADMSTTKWVPQGISSTADALDAGLYEGKDGLVVSWHRDDDKSARISLIDKSDFSYRHVLLVYPHAADDFREVPVHAGGIVWYGDTLWVVDTWNGIRVFDMSNIWRVGEDGDGVGKRKEGGYSAAGYKYVLPQIRWYKWTAAFPFRFSYISLDRTTTPDSLVVGEYQPSAATSLVRFARWDLDYTTRKLKSGGQASWAYCVNIDRMQGAVSANGKFYISRSNGGNVNGDAYGWVPGQLARENKGFWPDQPEDLSFDKRGGGKVYGLTEKKGERFVITHDAGDFKFS